MKNLNFFEIEARIEFDPKNYTKKHENQSSWKKSVIAYIDGDLCEYYSWFIKKRYNLELLKPLRKSHMTIVNDKFHNEKLWNKVKKKWDGKTIKIKFDVNSRTNGEHWWLRSDSEDARSLRTDLKLNPQPYYKYHITIGLTNSKTRFHSEYIHTLTNKFPEYHGADTEQSWR